jgi:UDPglucose 6-dehydrogenase
MQQAQSLLNEVIYCRDAYECVVDAHAVVIATEWEQFRALDLDRLRSLMAEPVLVDLRNIYHFEDVQRRGFAYGCVGKPNCGSVETPDLRDRLMPTLDKCESVLT